MWRIFILFCTAITVVSCNSREQADLLVFGGKIMTVNDSGDVVEAIVIKEGIICFTGSKSDALQHFSCKETLDVKGDFVYPGFNDAHCHFYGYGLNLQTVDLMGTKSWEEVLKKCKKFYDDYKPAVLKGRGWDQNDWEIKQFPDNKELSRLFPNIPVILKRVDGHAVIANNFLLGMAGVSASTRVEGGEILKLGGKPSGVLIDNAVDIAETTLPPVQREDMVKALIKASKQCARFGITSVTDAGLDREVIELIDSLQTAGLVSTRINAMIQVSENNLEFYLKKGPDNRDMLNVSSFKMYCDGALGSRGACLLNNYSDLPGHSGFLLTPVSKMEEYIGRIAKSPFQLSTHCIGDSGNRLVLKMYAKVLGENNQRRWRIEHAQVVNKDDFQLFGKFHIIPSVQPTHATSDMYWVEERLGKERTNGAYAYKRLLKQNGWMPLGTDFPVESPNPFYTFFAAVSRQDGKGYPAGGFRPTEKLTREETLKGMTIWAAKASFDEDKKGSLTKGKFADFIIATVDLLHGDLTIIHDAHVKSTWLRGKQIYQY